jgi:hypothetical protein
MGKQTDSAGEETIDEADKEVIRSFQIRLYGLMTYLVLALLVVPTIRDFHPDIVAPHLYWNGMKIAYALNFVLLWRFWRCPACERYLNFERPPYIRCPYCNVRFQ